MGEGRWVYCRDCSCWRDESGKIMPATAMLGHCRRTPIDSRRLVPAPSAYAGDGCGDGVPRTLSEMVEAAKESKKAKKGKRR